MPLIVVPLAGPDLYTKEFGIRPMYPYSGSTVLQHALAARPWYNKIFEETYQVVFVLRYVSSIIKELIQFIRHHFPFSKIVTLDTHTAGALLSVVAGISLVQKSDDPIIVDLADIIFDWGFDVETYFQENRSVDAVIPYFLSANPKFSYLKLDGSSVTMAREKQLISRNASAGVYLFRNASVYLRSVAFCLENRDMCQVGTSLFVCPAVNGIIDSGRRVSALPVTNVNSLSTIFH